MCFVNITWAVPRFYEEEAYKPKVFLILTLRRFTIWLLTPRLATDTQSDFQYKQLSWLVDNLENSVTMNSYKLSVCELIFISLILKVTNKLLSKNELAQFCLISTSGRKNYS
ncbi:hypothetical protein BCS95_06035 [Vibrio breoganii]|nr:hypothetical protein BCS95_06035 [Vibrio breoganii]